MLISFCNKAILPLVNQLDTKPMSKHSLNCDLTRPCKLPQFFNQSPLTKPGPEDFQSGIPPKIFLKLLGYIYLLLLNNIDFTLQVFQSVRISIMIYLLTPYVSPKYFRFFSIWLIITVSFSFLIQFPIKLPLIILKHSVLFQPICLFLDTS